MLIAQISDTHLIVDGPGSATRIADFHAVIADINALATPLDAIVHTGDIVHNGAPEEYAAAAEILFQANAPAYVLAGNKDNRANLRAAFKGRGYLPPDTGFITYTIEDFPVRLLMLDTTNPASKKGDFCAERFQRLQTTLGDDLNKPIAVFAHHPPFEIHVGPERFHYDDLQIMQRLANIVAAPNVQHLFCGHVHRPTSGAVRDVPATVITAVATELRFGDYPAEMTGRPTYLLHRYDAEQGFTTEIRIAGLSV